jgi:hypothetical protein
VKLTAVVTDLPDRRDRFRSDVGSLPPGPLRDLLVTVAYARAEAARTGATTASDDRWRAVVAAAERAIRTAAERAVCAAAERGAVLDEAPVALRVVA